MTPTPSAPPALALIVCDVFEQELALVTAGATHIVEQRVVEMGLHDRPDLMREVLQKIITDWECRTDIEAIALVYGLCGCGTSTLHSARHRLVIPRAHDCRAVLLGSRERFDQRQAACPGCYYYTPGWNRARRVPGPERDDMLRVDFAKKFDPEDIEFLMESEQSMWQHYDTAAYIDHATPGTAAEAAYTATCAEHLGWHYERVQGDLTWLRDLVWGRWDADRFQLIEAGHRMVHSPDAAIMRAEPVP
jgi:hypothetical protein